MKTFAVSQSEVHIATVLIMAESEQDAIDKFKRGEYNPTELELELTDVFPDTLTAEVVYKGVDTD